MMFYHLEQVNISFVNLEIYAHSMQIVKPILQNCITYINPKILFTLLALAGPSPLGN